MTVATHPPVRGAPIGRQARRVTPTTIAENDSRCATRFSARRRESSSATVAPAPNCCAPAPNSRDRRPTIAPPRPMRPGAQNEGRNDGTPPEPKFERRSAKKTFVFVARVSDRCRCGSVVRPGRRGWVRRTPGRDRCHRADARAPALHGAPGRNAARSDARR